MVPFSFFFRLLKKGRVIIGGMEGFFQKRTHTGNRPKHESRWP